MIDETPTVLIVDDDQTICDFVSEILIEDGYAYEIALNAHDAIMKIRNHHFDVALLDIKLPDKSGIDILEISHSFLQKTPIIMMTAVIDLDIAIQAMKMGASDYLVKPFSIDKLTASIKAALKNRKWYNSAFTKTEKIGEASTGRKAGNQTNRALNAIATGVDAQLDYFDLHSKTVTEKTVNIARRLGFPEKEIKKWEIRRKELLSERRWFIRYIFDKLKRNPLAQVMLGLTSLVTKFSQARWEQN